MTGGSERASEGTRTRHAPGLDGIRGIAVAAITAYHLGTIDGGILSVTVFFTLSGYLITSILLTGFLERGTVDLKTFWLRRARRLLPALSLLLVVVLSATAIARPAKLGAYARQALSAALYVANWATIVRGDDYFVRFSGPGPFDHLWSLAIEEQFYAVWPLLFLGLMLVGRRVSGARSGIRSLLPAISVTAVLAVASTLAMAWLYAPDAMNNTRAYEGTDARAAPILVGALTAMLLPLGRVGEGGRRRRVVLDVLGAASCAVVATVVLATHERSPFLYRGGEAVVSIATAVLVLAAAHPSTWVGKALGLAPFRWLGVRTYGVYLWHMPVVAFVPASLLAGHPVARAALQVALIVGLSALSWTLLEDPIRRDGLVATFFRGAGRTRARRWAAATVLAPLGIAALVAWPLSSPASASDLEALEEEATTAAAEPQPIELASAASVATPPGASRTSCTQVVHVGDSTSLGLMAKSYIPDPNERLDARYRSVGVKVFVAEIRGGRSIVEKLNGHPSAWEIVNLRRIGYQGCWVLALGNGDAATIHGNLPGLSKRIDWMMNAAAGRPVLWTTTKTLLDKGPYQDAYMRAWNHALVEACARHPNMRVYDYASEVQDAWYLPDAIHPNDQGAKERAARIAKALAIAFPEGGAPAKACVVGSTP